MEWIMLENVFLRKEIVMEVEVNWKLPAKVVIHTGGYLRWCLLWANPHTKTWSSKSWAESLGSKRALGEQQGTPAPRIQRRQELHWPDVAQSNLRFTPIIFCSSPPSLAQCCRNPAHGSQTPPFARLFYIKTSPFVSTWAHLYKYCCLQWF